MLRQSFRLHLALYVLVNALLVGIWAASASETFWPVWSILGWGFLLAAHAAPVIAQGASARHPWSVDRESAGGAARDAATSVDEVASSVNSERPSLRRAAAPDGTVTILFSDIEGSTALNERLGDVRWLELLRTHHRVVREQVHAHGGFEVKTQGDGFMIAFPSARRAVECASAIQRSIHCAFDRRAGGAIRLRIGLHTGEAIREEADFYGKNVVLAARIADEARGGEILASSVVKQLTESAGDLRFDNERELELDGLAGRHTVYEVLWIGGAG